MNENGGHMFKVSCHNALLVVKADFEHVFAHWEVNIADAIT